MGHVEIPKWLKDLPLAPEYHPTDTEFSDPIAYISKIEKEASAFGICKIIPPLPKPSKKYVLTNLNKSLSKRPELGAEVNVTDVSRMENVVNLNGGEGPAVFTTRHQELGKRSKGAIQLQPTAVHMQVWQSGEIYTLEQFESKSKAFAKTQLGMLKEVSPLDVEALFWNAASEKPIYVEYANDVPGSGFGEAEGRIRYLHGRRKRRKMTFDRKNRGLSDGKDHQVDMISNNPKVDEVPKSNANVPVDSFKVSNHSPNVFSVQISERVSNNSDWMEGSAGWKLANSPWNLQVIARSPGSLTRFMPDDIPGVTSPMVYIGMLFSWFAWHVEDHELHSLNFLHTGSSKTWYAVPGDYAFAFEEVIRNRAYGGNIDRLAALALLGHKTTLFSPEEVVSSGIPCCRLVQNPGDFVVTFPRAYHVGFSHGFNCGEAANFGTPRWLTVAKEAAVRRAAMNYLPMLSHQQLLYLLTMSFFSRVPRSLLPGVRSSRLRDRQKEERELLVKRAFIEDIMHENQLLSILLRKGASYYAVLWDLESLPLSSKELELCGDSVTPAPGEVVYTEKDSNQDLITEMRLYIESMNDLYADTDDLSSDFEVDSGTLPCVACGILGFPFMSIVQPSEKASLGLLPPNTQTSQDFAVLRPVVSLSPPNTNSMVQGCSSDNKEGEDVSERGISVPCKRNLSTSDGNCDVARVDPKFLVDANVTVSDATEEMKPENNGLSSYQKQENKNCWNFSNGFLRPRIFCLEHAIQIEELLHSRGGAKVLVICHSDFVKIKAHTAAIAEETRSPFKYNEIPLDNASQEDLSLINLAIDDERQDESQEDWTSKLGVNLQHCVKDRKKMPSEKVHHAFALGELFSDSSSHSNSFLNWKSKKSRSRQNLNNLVCSKSSEIIQTRKDDYIEEKSNLEMAKKEIKLIQYSRRKFRPRPCDATRPRMASTDLKRNASGDVSAVYCEVSGKNHINVGQSDQKFEKNVECVFVSALESDKKPANQRLNESSNLDGISAPAEVVPSVKISLPVENVQNFTQKDTSPRTKDSDSLEDDSQIQNGSKSSKGGGTCYDDETCDDVVVIAVRSNEMYEIERVDNSGMTNQNYDAVTAACCGIQASEYVLSEEISDISYPSGSSPNVKGFDKQVEKTFMVFSRRNNELLDQVIVDKKMPSIQNTTDVFENKPASSHVTSEPITPSEDSPDISRNTTEVSRSCGATDSGLNTRDGSKRKRVRDMQSKSSLSDSKGFIRSPCEGLRPREKKSNGSIEDKQETKQTKRPSNSSVARNNQKGKTGPHICDLEGCNMSFQTKAELLLHKHNRCPYDGCGKKFSSHKYAIFHQRVHDDDRPLKCPWKGCTMSFKWAWARTEHLRVHTGERPYKCKYEGCGLTFRFVSDYSRHRRKTGHYVDLPA